MLHAGNTDEETAGGNVRCMMTGAAITAGTEKRITAAITLRACMKARM